MHRMSSREISPLETQRLFCPPCPDANRRACLHERMQHLLRRHPPDGITIMFLPLVQARILQGAAMMREISRAQHKAWVGQLGMVQHGHVQTTMTANVMMGLTLGEQARGANL